MRVRVRAKLADFHQHIISNYGEFAIFDAIISPTEKSSEIVNPNN
jgi:hypothetical protein